MCSRKKAARSFLPWKAAWKLPAVLPGAGLTGELELDPPLDPAPGWGTEPPGPDRDTRSSPGQGWDARAGSSSSCNTVGMEWGFPWEGSWQQAPGQPWWLREQSSRSPCTRMATGAQALLAASDKNSSGRKAQARPAGSPGGWRFELRCGISL